MSKRHKLKLSFAKKKKTKNKKQKKKQTNKVAIYRPYLIMQSTKKNRN